LINNNIKKHSVKLKAEKAHLSLSNELQFYLTVNLFSPRICVILYKFNFYLYFNAIKRRIPKKNS